MGTYLAMGLKLVLQAYKPDVVKCTNEKSTVEDVLKRLERKCRIGDIYTRYEEDDCYEYRLNDSVLQQELCSFLKDFYDLCDDNDKDYQDKIFAAINGLPDQTLSSIIPILQERRFETFQDGDYSEYVYMTEAGTLSNKKIWTYTECAILSLEGKFMMECYDGLFEFLRKSIIAQMPDYKLSQAVNIWIEG
jgi:hypothetical protein